MPPFSIESHTALSIDYISFYMIWNRIWFSASVINEWESSNLPFSQIYSIRRVHATASGATPGFCSNEDIIQCEDQYIVRNCQQWFLLLRCSLYSFSTHLGRLWEIKAHNEKAVEEADGMAFGDTDGNLVGMIHGVGLGRSDGITIGDSVCISRKPQK